MTRWPLIILLAGLLSSTAASTRTVLLVDDEQVLYRSGTTRVLNPPTRHPANPLVKADKPWEVQIAWNSVWRDPDTGRYQMWYQAWNHTARERAKTCVVCYAESDDGIHFTKPQLDLFSFNDTPNTNIVLIGNGGHSYRYCNSVLVEPAAADASRRYKMAYFDWAKDAADGKEYPGLCVAFSPDGIHWTKHPRAPLSRIAYVDHETPLPFADEAQKHPWAVPLSMADAVDVMCDPVRNVYAWYGKMWLDGPAGGMAWKHAMGRSESKDFVDWSNPQLVAAPDDRDPPSVEFHTSPVFYHEGVYFSLNQILDRARGEGVIDVELMTSRDGMKWERNFRGPPWFLPRNPNAGAFDSGSVFTNATPVMFKDEMRFYFGGYAGGATGADNLDGNSGIGFATLPRDRFAGVRPVARSDQPTLKHPIEHVGQITLQAIELHQDDALQINADASGGDVRVELLDETARRVRGFTRDDAVPVTGDKLRHRVSWTKSALRDLPRGWYLLRLHLRRSTVFAVYVLSS